MDGNDLDEMDSGLLGPLQPAEVWAYFGDIEETISQWRQESREMVDRVADPAASQDVRGLGMLDVLMEAFSAGLALVMESHPGVPNARAE